MLTFAIVASRHRQRLMPGVLERLETAAAAQVPFPPDTSVTWVNDTGTVWFAGWRPSGRHDRDAGWHADGVGLTAVAGRVWPRRDGWSGTAPVAAQLADRLRTDPLTTSADTLAGVFVAASLHRHGHSALVADALGLGLLYQGRGDDVVVLSTRAAVAAALVGAATGSSPRRDAFGTGWLAYAGFPIGSRTGYEGIGIVPAGAVVEIAPDGVVEVRRPTEPVWRAHSKELAADPRTALDRVRTEITTALRTPLRHADVACRVGLTGGKDSRLILALLLADGSAGDVTFQTFGGDDLPDVEMARRLATDLGLRHVTNPGIADRMRWMRRVAQATGRTDRTWRELAFRMTVATTSGARSVHDPVLGRLARPNTALLSGLGGEMLRTNYPGSAGLRSKAQAARFPHRFGTAGIIDRDALQRYRREVHEILFDRIDEGDSPGDVIDSFYVSQRQRRWVGSTLEVDQEARVFPLYSMTGIRLAFGLGAENRSGEWIHRQLMRDAHEPLLHRPFADDAWRAPAESDLVEPAVHDDPIPADPPQPPERPRPSGSRKRSFVRDARARQWGADVEVMRRMFEPDAGNPAFELLDTRGVGRALDHFEDLRESERQQLYGALTTVIWLGGHELAVPRELASG